MSGYDEKLVEIRRIEHQIEHQMTHQTVDRRIKPYHLGFILKKIVENESNRLISLFKPVQAGKTSRKSRKTGVIGLI